MAWTPNKQNKETNKAKEKYIKNNMNYFFFSSSSSHIHLYPALLGIIYDPPVILKKKKTKQNTQG